MTQRLYKQEADRSQGILLPPNLEDYVDPSNPVRAIDTYVDTLELEDYGFTYSGAGDSMRGQPSYPPGALLKLYLYGYVNRVTSSRRLERETHRNMEVIWLMGKLRPSYKTIADFRKLNGKALKAVNQDFVLLCKELGLFGGEVVGIDGSFFQGNASKASIYTQKKLENQLKKIGDKIQAYQEQLETQDKNDDAAGTGHLIEDTDLSSKLRRLREKQAQKQALKKN